MDKVMKRYAFKDWDSVLASIGHGGLKEGQVINKMMEERVQEDQTGGHRRDHLRWHRRYERESA